VYDDKIPEFVRNATPGHSFYTYGTTHRRGRRKRARAKKDESKTTTTNSNVTPELYFAPVDFVGINATARFLGPLFPFRNTRRRFIRLRNNYVPFLRKIILLLVFSFLSFDELFTFFVFNNDRIFGFVIRRGLFSRFSRRTERRKFVR